jgi:exosortase family protein XrtF
VSYFVLSGLYQWYLTNNQQKGEEYTCSPITKIVADQTVSMANTFNFQFRSEQHPTELSIKLFTNGNYTARVVEGCNSLSIIILFWAFIIAFKGNLLNTLLFGVLGSLLIYLLNIARIVFLTIALDSYPQHSHFLHQIIFPSIIYGFTFFLWVIWVRYFALKERTDE